MNADNADAADVAALLFYAENEGRMKAHARKGRNDHGVGTSSVARALVRRAKCVTLGEGCIDNLIGTDS
jgi:hypothetical protein